MQSNKEKDELIKNLQKEVIFDFTSFHWYQSIYTQAIHPLFFLNQFNSHATNKFTLSQFELVL